MWEDCVWCEGVGWMQDVCGGGGGGGVRRGMNVRMAGECGESMMAERLVVVWVGGEGRVRGGRESVVWGRRVGEGVGCGGGDGGE